LNCPKDNTPLVAAKTRGIDVDKCPTCAGMWLDAQELDQLEDTVFDEDELKGSLIPSETATSFPCPRCGAKLNQFDYRFYDLVLEHCPNNDGFWLDADEDKQVLDKIAQRAQSMQRKVHAESEWAKVMTRWRKKS
jgi:Zn-finger nucleic acid-binding protein